MIKEARHEPVNEIYLLKHIITKDIGTMINNYLISQYTYSTKFKCSVRTNLQLYGNQDILSHINF